MDFERDYILRMIHMMGDFMRRLAERLDDVERGLLMDDACRKLCGIPLAAGETLTVESLLGLLGPVPRLMLSELLYAKAQSITTLTDTQIAGLTLKALRLLSSLHAEARLCDLRAGRLVALKAAVLDQLTADDLMACARFFAQAEQYDAMEDALFQAIPLTQGDERAHCRAEGAAMLRRAAKATAQALALCRMTGEELRLSAHELETD